MQFYTSSILAPLTTQSHAMPAGMEQFMLPGSNNSSLSGDWGICCSQSFMRKEYSFYVHHISALSTLQLFASTAVSNNVLLIAQQGSIKGSVSLDSYQANLFYFNGQIRNPLVFQRGDSTLVEIMAPALSSFEQSKPIYISRESQLLLQELPYNYITRSIKELYLDGVVEFLLTEYLTQSSLKNDTVLLAEAPFHFNLKDLDNTRKAKAIIDAAIHKRYTVRELASLAGTNRNMLNQAFQYVFKQTIHQYWLTISLQYARQLVIERNDPVKVIATNCGFDHYAHFIQQFKRHWGVTPGEMRKTI